MMQCWKDISDESIREQEIQLKLQGNNWCRLSYSRGYRGRQARDNASMEESFRFFFF